ncbi:MAG: hypothetical protein PQJ61_16310 [Spirochaetales bacterium]|uniref:Uncharacterized protein n=1 Tax=Candidatus Thalassospirochaeta sargassi TaxID=3119039 RepID=A0AAJ1II01_9SPIO|nr:hypothetical protein [Spirochaetales bacterium]
MKFGTLSEQQIKEAAGGKLDKLIALWHADIKKKYGKRVDIVLGNRRDSLSPVRGGILTNAVIEMKGEDSRLMIWYDPLELYYEARISELGYDGGVIEEITAMLRDDSDPGMDYDPVSNPDKLDINSIAVQLGRWLMKIRGFAKLANENPRYYELETFLNSECGIPVLYNLFNEADYSYAETEEKRLIEVYEGLRNMDEPKRRVDIALNALRVSNILAFSTDSEVKSSLQELLKDRFERIMRVSTEIDKLKSGFELSSPDGLSKFMKKLVLQYHLPGSWVTVDETTGVF